MSVVLQESGEKQPAKLERFVEQLRSPGLVARKSARELADEFGLDPSFVQDVLTALHAPRKRVPLGHIAWKAISRTSGQVYDVGKSLWLKSTNNPMLFVILTGLAGYLVTYLYQSAVARGGNVDPSFNIGQILVVTFVLHQLCFARHGKLRYPIFGAGAAALATLVASLGQVTTVAGWGELTIGALLTAALYAFLGGIAALVGGLVIIQKRDREVRSLPRHEALNRLFLLKEKLEKVGLELSPARNRKSWVEIAQSDPKWPLTALAGGLAFGALRVLILGGYQHLFPTLGGANDPIYWMFRIFSAIVTGIGFLMIGFLSGSFSKAVLSQFVAYAGFWVSSFISLGGFGPRMAIEQLSPSLLLPMVVPLLVSGSIAGLGTVVENESKREQRRLTNDPASIVAEIVHLERYLNAASAATSVVSVDVARSTAMKVDQDPLVVEWSFREYHNLLVECANQACGQVLSTSGDGAILTFSDPRDALTAAKDIQTKINWFNMRVNRLESPFRVRIGVHTDEVQGDLGDVQFTEVIDIAAHVQTHSPVGGILVTDKVAKVLPDEQLSELKQPVEGRMVWLVVNPTLGA